jgi:hypothetical protein
MGASGASHAAGIVPDPGATAGSTRYLNENATWATITAAQVTNAVSALGSYADPAWITSLGWSKIAGVPSSVTSPLTTKGDIHTYSTMDTRLGVGADGQVLTSDSTQATGIKWAAPTGGGGTPAAPVGAVQWNNSGAFGASANLTWDNANSRLGIGTASPLVLLDLPGYSTNNSQLRIGGMEFQAYGLNNNSWTDNIYYGASGWVYRNTGPGGVIVNNGGVFAFNTCPSGNAGAAATVTERMRITSGGSVGIGTASPLQVLDVSSAINNTDIFQCISEGGERLRLGYAGGANAVANNILPAQVLADQVGNLLLSARTNYTSGIILYTSTGSSALERMRITSGGNVGIGTTSPNFPLSFGSGVGDKIALWDGGPGSIYGFGMQSNIMQVYCPSGNRVGIGYGSSAAFTETLSVTGGKVGVGTTSPSALLDVAGSIRTTNQTSTPTTGAGVEVLYTGSQGYILAYDRTASVYKPLYINSAPVVIGQAQAGSNTPPIIATGFNTAGTSGFTGNYQLFFYMPTPTALQICAKCSDGSIKTAVLTLS